MRARLVGSDADVIHQHAHGAGAVVEADKMVAFVAQEETGLLVGGVGGIGDDTGNGGP